MSTILASSPAQQRVFRGDELVPGRDYTLASTRQTKKFPNGTSFFATKLVVNGARAVVSDEGSVLYATDNDIFIGYE